MRLRIFVLMVVLLAGCELDDEDKIFQPLTFDKTPYTGVELRTDGYYYSDPDLTTTAPYGVIVFYRDGVCIQTYTDPEGQNLFDHIENTILLNHILIKKLWDLPSGGGIFQVINDSLKYDIWNRANYGHTVTYSHFGIILNDTTFVETKFINRNNYKTFTENLTYHFKQFSPKPDSTNRFIK